MHTLINKPQEILFEGLSEREILDLPADEIDGLIFIDIPVVFRAGSATVLGRFRREGNRLVIELAQIDGGGEGVLVSLGALARKYASLHGIEAVEWIVHAVNCAKPNLKLRRVLSRRGFAVRDIPGLGEAWYFLDVTISSLAKRKVRVGWAEASREIASQGDDKLVLGEFPNKVDDELTW